MVHLATILCHLESFFVVLLKLYTLLKVFTVVNYSGQPVDVH